MRIPLGFFVGPAESESSDIFLPFCDATSPSILTNFLLLPVARNKIVVNDGSAVPNEVFLDDGESVSSCSTQLIFLL